MFVRVVTFTGAGDIDGGLQFLTETVAPLIRQQHGWRGTTASASRANGEFSVLTQWETQADLDASESAMLKARADAQGIVGGDLSVDYYEQVVLDIVKPPRVGARLLIRPISMDPSKVDENIEFFKSTVMPQITSAPGYLALRNLINRETGQGALGTLWESDEALDAAAIAAEERRGMGEQRGLSFGDLSKRETVFVDMP